ncbi:hypothetical protein [Pedobacter chinensis]|nr:hypothetical protein [Pedobacter chinensis]
MNELHYNDFDDFSGSIMYYSLQNEFNNGYVLENGTVKKGLSPAPEGM